jgi:hypothetical protein
MSSSAHPSVVHFVLEALDTVSKVSRIDSSNNIGEGRRSEEEEDQNCEVQVAVKKVCDRMTLRRRSDGRKNEGRGLIALHAPDFLECFCDSKRYSRGEVDVCDQGNIVPKVTAMSTWK